MLLMCSTTCFHRDIRKINELFLLSKVPYQVFIWVEVLLPSQHYLGQVVPLGEELLMSTHNICISREIRKILCGYPFLSVAMLGGSAGCTFDWWSGGCEFNPCRVSKILLRRLIMKYFLRSSPFQWFKKGNCQFLVKECVQYNAWSHGGRGSLVLWFPPPCVITEHQHLHLAEILNVHWLFCAIKVNTGKYHLFFSSLLRVLLSFVWTYSI